MASQVPYYYSDLKKGSIPESEKNNLNKVENPYEKGRGFDNPLLAIEPDIAICDVPERVSTYHKKKKKKKNLATPVYRRSNSLISNSTAQMSSCSNYARKEMQANDNTASVPRKDNDSSAKRRSSEPNIYEEIPEPPQEDVSCYSGSIQAFPSTACSQGKKCDDRASIYSSKIILDEEEKVQQTHNKIIEKLNLDVEAMLMPEDTACSDELRSEREMNKHSDYHINAETKSHVLSPGTPPLYFASARWQGSCSTLPKPETSNLSCRIMNEYILQQSDFGPGKGYLHGQKASMGHQASEDNIYEEVDLQQLYRTNDYGDTMSWAESELALDHSHSSGSEEHEDEFGCSKVAEHSLGKKDKNSRKHKETEGIAGRFTRWLSTRKKEYELENGVNKFHRHSQVLCTDEEGYVDVKIPKKKRPPLSLPPMPPGLTQEKLKRRLIVGSIVDSENSYVNSLHQLITDYKFPLENSNPPIVSANKISKMFLHLENILQCHKFFGIALTQCVRQWDQEEKIGDVFVDSFSKTIVLDTYSEFINNFSVAMETAKQASKNKSAFADFLKVKQINSSNRLSFFGLMVKPVQRFPQFILLLQDLLKHTPHGHHDRMSLQLAMTQLGSLAETLNERKKEAEQHHAVKEILKHLGKFSLKSFTDRDHYLLRQDDVVRFQFDHSGLVIKSKKRRLFLLNDLLVAVSVTPRSTDGLQSGERLNSKWAVPLQDVEVQEDASPATRNLIASSGRHRHSATRSTERHMGGGTVQALYDELSDLVHDLEVTSRISALVSSLRRSYPGLNLELLQGISHSIQAQIRQKDEEITILDSCCLQLLVPIKSKSSKESICFQMKSPAVKREWTTELRMAKLALDSNNTPAWHVSEQEKRPSSKMPLFVNAVCPYPTSSASEAKCGCHYTVYNSALPQQYVWMCSSDGINSHVVVMSVHFNQLRVVAAYYLGDNMILAIDSAPAMLLNKGCVSIDNLAVEENKCTQTDETVWIGTLKNKNEPKLLLLNGSCPNRWEEVGSTTVPASIVQIKHYYDQMFVALEDGTIAVFHRDPEYGLWQLENPSIISLEQDPVTCLLPMGAEMYCACGPKIWIFDVLTHEMQQSYSVQHEDDGQAFLLAHSGAGLWVALKNSAKICLYHTETFHHLHHINISDNVNSILSNKAKSPAIYITSLVASKGLLWVGTNVGILLTVPLPRLEGVPLITGCISLSFHAHQGPVTLLLSLQPKSISHPHFPSPSHKRPASADGNNESLSTGSRNQVVKQVSDSVLPSQAYCKRNSGSQFHKVSDVHASGAKTLPRGMTFCQHVAPHEIEESNDVYGLYADLMNVQDYEKDSQEKLHERLNHSDPELVNFHLDTLDRRVQQKSGRPRSWDLSAMAVSDDSDSSAAYETSSTATAATAEIGAVSSDSTSVETNASPSQQPKSLVSTTKVSSARTLKKSTKKSLIDSSPKTLLMLTGGSGYVNWRKPEKDGMHNVEPHVMIWEVKL